jgi:hypothetical protein
MDTTYLINTHLELGNLGSLVELELNVLLGALLALLLRLLEPGDERGRLLVNLLSYVLVHVLLGDLRIT